METWTVVGTVASIAGLLLGIWVLLTSMGAKKAAEDALKLARRRGLVEELEEVGWRIQQLGDHSISQEWAVVRIRADELLSNFKSMLARWPDGMSEHSRNNLLVAGTLVSSIKELSSDAAIAPLTEQQRKKVTAAQTRANEIVGGVLGEARRSEERPGG